MTLTHLLAILVMSVTIFAGTWLASSYLAGRRIQQGVEAAGNRDRQRVVIVVCGAVLLLAGAGLLLVG